MIRAAFLWFQLLVGFLMSIESLAVLRWPKRRTWRRWLALAVGLTLLAIGVFELFVIEYRLLPTGLTLPVLFALDCAAVLLYALRPRVGSSAP